MTRVCWPPKRNTCPGRACVNAHGGAGTGWSGAGRGLQQRRHPARGVMGGATCTRSDIEELCFFTVAIDPSGRLVLHRACATPWPCIWWARVRHACRASVDSSAARLSTLGLLGSVCSDCTSGCVGWPARESNSMPSSPGTKKKGPVSTRPA